jgi:3-dehydrosphinganine reductase
VAPGFKVANRHVFITGGSSGLGLALAKQYARSGAKVSIVARNAKSLANAKREIESRVSSDATTHPVFTRVCDVTDLADVEKAVEEANAFHQRVTDHVICNAGFFEPGLLLEQDPSMYRKTMDVNFFGSYHTVKATLPHMVKTPLSRDEPKRRVIFVASAGSLATIVGYGSYASSKYALRGFSDTMRNELQLYGIETSIFFPAKIHTPMIAREMPGKPAAAEQLDSHSVAVSADTAARALVHGLSSGYYAITLDPISEMLRITGNGIPQRNNLMLEVLLLPFLALMQVPQRWYSDWVVRSDVKKTTQ